ncbi:MAG: dephospho-CoA kinase [Planctomycetes bacterium]|nr:dephospho-CoA kinase [Planctomycetota bacterium]
MIVGILGGIGSGKSTVAHLLAEQGAELIDADALARAEIERPEVRREIEAWIGPEAFREDGGVDREALARRVFPHPQDLHRLEQLVHPGVLLRIDQRIEDFLSSRRAPQPEGLAGGVLVLDVPLLATSPLLRRCDAVIYVEADPQRRVERVRPRGWSAEELGRRESLQPPLEEKRRIATAVIDNNGRPEETRSRLLDLLESLRASAPARGGRSRPQRREKEQARDNR